MRKPLLIVFVKNIRLGKVKTRLANSIGNENAFQVYRHLVHITEYQTQNLENCEVRIYFSDSVIEDKWPNRTKYIQVGEDLGKRMLNAFKEGFNDGFEPIIGIGSDLPDITSELIYEGFTRLESNDLVFGPALDGGYYLIGMNQLQSFVFTGKAWSTDSLLLETLKEAEMKQKKVALLQPLNDIDTIEDLRGSSIKHLFNF